MAAKPKAKRIGDLQRVVNTGRKFGADPVYYFARLQFPEGREVPMLFTNKQLEVAEDRAWANPEDLLQAGVVRNLLD